MKYTCPNCGCKEATVSDRWPEEYLCPFVVAECPECSTREESEKDAIDFREFEQRWKRSDPFKRRRTEPDPTYYRERTPMENFLYHDEHSEYL